MAGSYAHITDDKGRFTGTRLLDNLGDAYEALEECYGMIHYLADISTGYRSFREERIAEARQNYKVGLAMGGVAEDIEDL